jgi:threonine/homoserine/homoserine lactone efflux protein
MPDPATLTAFIAAAFILSVTPGPDMALLISRGIGHGWKSAWFTALGFTLAGLIQIPLLALGIASVFASSPLAFDLLRYAGAAYLIWRGIKLIWSAAGAPHYLVALNDGLVASLTNPKVLVFLLAFLPQFVKPEQGSVMLQFAMLGLALKLVALAVETTIALSAGALGRSLARWPRFTLWQQRVTCAILIGLGMRLLTMDARAR